jgi:hypothetical protein
MEQESKRRPGRPATGVTPKRNVRIGATWDRAEELAQQLGMTTTAYVEEALRRENARVERQLGRRAPLAQMGDDLGAVFDHAAGRSAPTPDKIEHPTFLPGGEDRAQLDDLGNEIEERPHG